MILDYIKTEIDLSEHSQEVYLLFESENCPVCMELKNKLNHIEPFMCCKVVDVYKNENLAKELRIIGTPCFVKMKEKIEDKRFYGDKKIEYLIRFLNEEDYE